MFDKNTLRRTTKLASAEALKKQKIRTEEEEERRKKFSAREQHRYHHRELTQAELMKEALETEVINRQSYLELVRLEEERKKYRQWLKTAKRKNLYQEKAHFRCTVSGGHFFWQVQILSHEFLLLPFLNTVIGNRHIESWIRPDHTSSSFPAEG